MTLCIHTVSHRKLFASLDRVIYWVGQKFSLEFFHESESVSHLVMSYSLWPHWLEPTRLLCPWHSPGKNTGVGSHFLLQGIFPTQGSNPGFPHCEYILYHLSHQTIRCYKKTRMTILLNPIQLCFIICYHLLANHPHQFYQLKWGGHQQLCGWVFSFICISFSMGELLTVFQEPWSQAAD